MFDETHKAKLAAAIELAAQHSGKASELPACSGVYVMLNKISRAMYIGQSHNIQRRATTHRKDLRVGHQNPGVRKDCEGNGEHSFGFALIEPCGLDQLDAFERAYIRTAVAVGICHNIMLAGEPQTLAQRQAWFRQRKAKERRKYREAGLVEVRGIYAYHEDHAEIRRFAKELTEAYEQSMRGHA